MKPYTITEVRYQGDITVLTFKDGSKAHLADNTSGVRCEPGTEVRLLDEEEVDELYDAMLAFQTGSLPKEFLSGALLEDDLTTLEEEEE